MVNEFFQRIFRRQESNGLFVSKHSFPSTDVPARVRGIDWFAHCGDDLSIDLSMPVHGVSNWKQAVEACKSEQWENVELEASNQLTQWLHDNRMQEYREWNEHVDAHKSTTIEPIVDTCIKSYIAKHNLDVTVLHSVQWAILKALMENTYIPTGHKEFFFLELLTVYEAGHFPCGWSGRWPNGQLVVY